MLFKCEVYLRFEGSVEDIKRFVDSSGCQVLFE